MIPLFSQQYTKTCRTPAHWWTFNTACSFKATSCRLSDPLRGHLSTWQEILPEGAVSKPSQDTLKGNTNRLGRSLLLSNDCAPTVGTYGKGGTPSKKMNVPRGDTRLAFHQQVKQALQIISSQSVFETKYRISRPSLGIRAGKLASYQVTLRGNKIHSFLSRFSELWSSQSKLLDTVGTSGTKALPTVGTYGMGGSTISTQSFQKVPMAGDSRGGIPSVTPNISI